MNVAFMVAMCKSAVNARARQPRWQITELDGTVHDVAQFDSVGIEHAYFKLATGTSDTMPLVQLARVEQLVPGDGWPEFLIGAFIGGGTTFAVVAAADALRNACCK